MDWKLANSFKSERRKNLTNDSLSAAVNVTYMLNLNSTKEVCLPSLAMSTNNNPFHQKPPNQNTDFRSLPTEVSKPENPLMHVVSLTLDTFSKSMMTPVNKSFIQHFNYHQGLPFETQRASYFSPGNIPVCSFLCNKMNNGFVHPASFPPYGVQDGSFVALYNEPMVHPANVVDPFNFYCNKQPNSSPQKKPHKLNPEAAEYIPKTMRETRLNLKPKSQDILDKNKHCTMDANTTGERAPVNSQSEFGFIKDEGISTVQFINEPLKTKQPYLPHSVISKSRSSSDAGMNIAEVSEQCDVPSTVNSNTKILRENSTDNLLPMSHPDLASTASCTDLSDSCISKSLVYPSNMNTSKVSEQCNVPSSIKSISLSAQGKSCLKNSESNHNVACNDGSDDRNNLECGNIDPNFVCDGRRGNNVCVDEQYASVYDSDYGGGGGGGEEEEEEEEEGSEDSDDDDDDDDDDYDDDDDDSDTDDDSDDDICFGIESEEEDIYCNNEVAVTTNPEETSLTEDSFEFEETTPDEPQKTEPSEINKNRTTKCRGNSSDGSCGVLSYILSHASASDDSNEGGHFDDDDSDYGCEFFGVDFEDDGWGFPVGGLVISDIVPQHSLEECDNRISNDLNGGKLVKNNLIYGFDEVDSGGSTKSIDKIEEELKIVNQRWNDDIDKDWVVSTPPKVKFCDSVQTYPVVDCCRRGPWEECARDRLRFQRRIEETESSLNPVLNPEHRRKVFDRLNL